MESHRDQTTIIPDLVTVVITLQKELAEINNRLRSLEKFKAEIDEENNRKIKKAQREHEMRIMYLEQTSRNFAGL
jgi:TolA-binding protein